MNNYIAGQWQRSSAVETLPIVNPATGESSVARPSRRPPRWTRRAGAAARAFPGWRRTPVTERIQYLFKLKALLEEHFDDIARTITLECGKTLAESRGEMRRGIENVEVACGIPS